MSLVLIDTSVWARHHQPHVRKAVADAIEANAVAMVVPVMLELRRSARDHAELLALAEEYEALHLIPLEPDLGKRARAVQAALAKRGHHRGPSPVDLLTAAAAESVSAELWHCDKHFELMKQIPYWHCFLQNCGTLWPLPSAARTQCRARLALPEERELETFPFKRQPGVNQRQLRTFAELELVSSDVARIALLPMPGPPITTTQRIRVVIDLRRSREMTRLCSREMTHRLSDAGTAFPQAGCHARGGIDPARSSCGSRSLARANKQ